MAYETITVRQSKSFSLTGEDGDTAVSFDSAVLSGSMLVVIGAGYDVNIDDALLLSSVSGGGTWGSVTNARTASSWAPNAFAAVAHNVSAGSPTVTLAWNAATNNNVSCVLMELTKVATSSAIDKSVTGTSASTSISTSATGTLTQTHNLAILCAGGWIGTPSNPSGWVSDLTQTNGMPSVGCQVSHKNVTATDSITGTVTFSDSGVSSALLLIIKSAVAGSGYKYKFMLNDATFTSADTGITGYVWRNGDPDTVMAEKYTGLAGDATAGVLYITSGLPATVSGGDTIVGSFYNSADGSRPFVTGTVENA
ncbi:MAG: hypothetical protein IT298_14815 [Chloroflexi bacterium]|nr:hypothetical protein [Chloroflexota bacterium]